MILGPDPQLLVIFHFGLARNRFPHLYPQDCENTCCSLGVCLHRGRGEDAEVVNGG